MLSGMGCPGWRAWGGAVCCNCVRPTSRQQCLHHMCALVSLCMMPGFRRNRGRLSLAPYGRAVLHRILVEADNAKHTGLEGLC